MNDHRVRDRRTRLLVPRSCRSYGPGHTVHYIQARLSASDEENVPVPDSVSGWEGDIVTVELDAGVRRYHNHDIERLRDTIERFGPFVRVQERWRILRAGSYLFSIALPSDEWRRCRR